MTAKEIQKIYFSKWCHAGKSVLNFDFTILKLIKNLLIVKSKGSENFQKYIREFNSASAFGAKNIVSMQGRGPYGFKIQGKIYYLTSNLKTDAGNRNYNG